MKWFLQLKLILWKNFLLRKRQKTRCIAEFLWPLFLFLILMWVRTRGLRSNRDECHLTEKAMPSAGSFPFLQSFICTFNNTCHQTLANASVHPIDFSPSSIKKLMAEITAIIQGEDAPKTENSFQKALTFVGDFADYLRSLNNNSAPLLRRVNKRSYSKEYSQFLSEDNGKTETLPEKTTGSSRNSIDKIDFNYILKTSRNELCKGDTKNVDKDTADFIKDLCQLSPTQFMSGMILLKTYHNYLNKDGLPVSVYSPLFIARAKELAEYSNTLKSKMSELQVYTDLLKNSTDPEKYPEGEHPELLKDDRWKKVRQLLTLSHQFLCGESSSDFLAQISGGNKPHALDSLQDQMKDKIRILYKYDNSTTPQCNQVMEWVQRVPPLRAFWDIIKPFIMGKILYYPKTPATDRVMTRINETFDPIRHLKKFFDNPIPTDSEENLQSEVRNLQALQDFVSNSLRLVKTYGSINDSLSSDDLHTLEELHMQMSLMLNNTQQAADGQFSIKGLLSCLETEKVRGFTNVYQAREYGMELLYKNKLFGLIEFEDPGEDELNPLVTYKIRMNVDKVDDTNFIKDRLQTPGGRLRATIDIKYLTYGFAYMQDLIDRSIIIEQTGQTDIPGIIFQQFPYPCYIVDQFIMAISRTFPLFMVLSFVYTCSMIVKAVVYEKEERLKETMRVMGLNNGIHWCGWLIDSLVPIVITNICLTLVLVYGKILTYADPTLLFVFLIAYSLATISQSFLISIFFSRANLAAACAGTIFFVLYLPYPFLARWMYFLLPYHKALLSLSSNVALGVGASYFALYEERGIGASWDNISESPLYGDNFNLLYVIYLLLLDFILYLFLTIYIEAVFPGQFGIPKPWYFPVTLSYWTGRQPRKVFVKQRPPSVSDIQEINEEFEPEPVGLNMGVSIVNMSKVYGNGKRAVNNISLNFYQDHITSFLGHNGAGKTTTISILTGIYTATEGTAFINGLDISTDMDKIRNNLGMCPQYNVLFNRLTVEEHLLFYGRMRSGKERSETMLRAEIEQMLTDLDLVKKRHSLPGDLSGGMQRKLSISVAFIGGSKTVILDEPTSGVDPYSRRSIWELLIKYKKGRTIILTTHFMDEADLLGDRIAIIANGRLRCCGSGVFLKSRLGDGYRLTVEMNQCNNVLVAGQTHLQGLDTLIEDEPVSALVTHVKSIIPNALFAEQIGSEVSIILPRSNSMKLCIELFSSLEDKMKELNVASYGISDTSLEEIFLRVAEQGDTSRKELTRTSRAEMSLFSRLYTFFLLNKSTPSPFNGVHDGKLTKDTTVPLDENVKYEKQKDNKYWRQFWALHIKRFHHTKRNGKALFAEIILPAIFVCMALVVCSIFPTMHERPPLTIDPFIYPKPRQMFYTEEKSNHSFKPIISEMLGPVGLGTHCMMINNSRPEDCESPNGNEVDPCEPIHWSKCKCNTGAQVCPANIGNPQPPSTKLATGDRIFNMKNQNLSYWIVNTWPRYENTRYGGYTFGESVPVPEIDIVPSLEKLYSAYEKKNMFAALPVIYTLQKSKTSSNNIKVWFNNKGWISSVAYLNAINNVVLRASLEDTNSSEYGIVTINHPMNYTEGQMRIELIKQGGISLLLAISIIFSLSFVPASFTLFIIEERATNSKHLQLVSGVNRLIYWAQTFSWDFICYLFSASLCIIIFFVFDEQAYISKDNFPGLLLLFILYGWSCIPLMYPMSFLFSVPSSAFVSLSCANVFIGIITTITTFVLGAFDDPELKYIDNIIKEVFLIFPHFCLGDGLIKLATSHIFSETVTNFDIEFSTNILSFNSIGKNLLCMFVEGILFSLLALAVEFEVFSKPFSKKKVFLDEFEPSFEEDDVRAERTRVNQNKTSSDTLVIKNLTKVYRKAQKPSVNKVCVGVRQGECFGLLGLNGAGKTSTFKMLTGAMRPTSGDAYVKGLSVVNEMDNVRSLLGYCPQFDALDSLLTPREHLLLYGRIKNIPSDSLNHCVDEMLHRLNLGHYSDRLAGNLSGGNKRKLSTAIALMGNPSLVFLDEPTTGMDPKARRFLWTFIQELTREGCCVVLTSHSMEECQALCTKLTIMVNGQFKCLGTSQHLKNKYGGGYSVVIRCNEENVNSTKKFMSTIQNSKLIESHYNQLRYQIGCKKVSEIFQGLENARTTGLIIDYSLSQTTLEDVFMRFANEQSDSPKEDRKVKKKAFVKKCLICYSDHSTN